MRITPLVAHAAARVPQMSNLFSSTVTAEINALAGGVTTITCSSSHNLTIGDRVAVCVRDAKIQIPITSVEVSGDDALVTFSAEHGLTNNAANDRMQSWNPSIEFTGFADSLMNTSHEFISVVSSTECLIRMPENADLTPSVDSAMFSSWNTSLAGWHPVTVTDEVTLTMPTPVMIQQDAYASGATVATNIRIWGALNFDFIKRIYSQEGDDTVKDMRMFISPVSLVAMSKDRNAKTSAVAELTPNVLVRQMLLDGFHVTVVVPTTESRSGLLEADLCHSEVLALVMRVFQGFIPPHPNLNNASPFAAILKQHGGILENRAFYVHEFEFEAPVQISNQESMRPWENTEGVLLETSTNPEQVGSAQPVGTLPLGELKFDGIYNSEMEQPLTARIDYEDQT